LVALQHLLVRIDFGWAALLEAVDEALVILLLLRIAQQIDDEAHACPPDVSLLHASTIW
jgi:hypothetical protein